MIKISISSEFIKLDSFLKFAGICQTGGEAKLIIKEKMVKVNNEICLQRGKKLFDKDIVFVNKEEYEVIKVKSSQQACVASAPDKFSSAQNKEKLNPLRGKKA